LKYNIKGSVQYSYGRNMANSNVWESPAQKYPQKEAEWRASTEWEKKL